MVFRKKYDLLGINKFIRINIIIHKQNFEFECNNKNTSKILRSGSKTNILLCIIE